MIVIGPYLRMRRGDPEAQTDSRAIRGSEARLEEAVGLARAIDLTIAEALVQVGMHTQHHRGQCMTRLKDFGGEPKNVDWIIWLWKEKPQGRWS